MLFSFFQRMGTVVFSKCLKMEQVGDLSGIIFSCGFIHLGSTKYFSLWMY